MAAPYPAWTTYFKLDQIAETWDGIGSRSPIYLKLWNSMKEEPFYETPDGAFCGPNVLSKHWKSFSKEEKATLTAAYKLNYEGGA